MLNVSVVRGYEGEGGLELHQQRTGSQALSN